MSNTIKTIKEVKAEKEAKFLDLYNRLNNEQRKAVDTIEGPVMVIAGPGTGKTSILTMRIANILKKTDTAPSSILALTFTESGVSSMRKKLVDLIGSSAYKVNIFTFHGFCNTLISRYPERFTRIIGSRNISEADQIKIVESIINELNLKKLKPWSNQYHYVKPIISQLRDLKREAIKPDDLERILSKEEENIRNADDLYHTKGAHKGKMKAHYTKRLEDNDKNNELLLVYRAYEDKLFKLRAYDYEDMILEAISLMEKDEDFLRILQEEYQYILADEHQDANNAQNKILELLSNFHDSPNLFVVGDEKQAIFKFQGATLENFLYFKKKYPKVTLIKLIDNYRSTQDILDTSHSLMTVKKTPKDIERPRLISKNGGKESKNKTVFIHEFQNKDSEYEFFASNIKDLIEKGVPKNEIAILYRNNKDAFPIAEYLSNANIPTIIESDSDLLSNSDVRKILILLKAIANLCDEEYLANILFFDFFNLKPIDVFKVIKTASLKRKALFDVIGSKEILEEVGVTDIDKFISLRDKLSNWALKARNLFFVDFFGLLIEESGIVNKFISVSDSVSKLSALNSFFSEIKKASLEKREFYISDFIEYIDLIENHNIFIKGTLLDEGDGVRLMTLHKSKGLEFEYVFIADVVHSKWEGKRDRTDFRLPKFFSLKDKQDADLNDSNNENGDESEGDDDERRLLYVGITRAKKEVNIAYSLKGIDLRDELPSQFISEISSEISEKIIHEKTEEKGGGIKIYKNGGLIAQDKNIFDIEYIKFLFIKEGFSATSINNFIECPIKYFFVSLIRLPQAQTKQMLYGNAIHEALQSYFIKYRNDEPVGKEYLLNSFEYHLKKMPLSLKDYEESLNKGIISLGGYFDAYKDTWRKNIKLEHVVEVESKISHTGTEVVFPLRGRLDKIEIIDGQNVNVVDYKTGKPRTRNSLEGQTKDKDSLKYKRQLVFYKIMLDLDIEEGFSMKTAELDFTEPNEKGVYKKEVFEISDAEVEELKGVINDSAMSIYSGEFLKNRCDNKDCQYCKLIDSIS